MKQSQSFGASRTRPRSQRGVMLIEALVAIAIFSFAILGIVGLQATAIRTVSEADYRAKASFFATQIVGQMWVDRFNVPTYALNAGTTACATGTNSATNTAMTNWLEGLTDLSKPGALPGAANLKQQITVGANNTVTVTICWKSPQEADATPAHNFTLTTQIQG
jgi:type IV pilus assembly protein PilV